MRPRCTKASAVGFTLATFAALIVVTFGSSTSNAEPVDVSTTAQKQAPSSGPQTLGQPEVGVDGASAAAERVRSMRKHNISLHSLASGPKIMVIIFG